MDAIRYCMRSYALEGKGKQDNMSTQQIYSYTVNLDRQIGENTWISEHMKKHSIVVSSLDQYVRV